MTDSKTLRISEQWKHRMELLAEGYKLWAEGYKLRAEGDKLLAEGYKLRAEGDKLLAEGDKLWAEAILEAYGNIAIKWTNWHSDTGAYECHLENGDVYIPEPVEAI